MKQDALGQAERYSKAHQRKKRWYQVVTCLAAVVVFCTTYALILPAITLENGQCELPEHTHTQECYTQVTSVSRRELSCSLELHQHTQDCYDQEGNLVCGYADFVVHTHNSACYDTDGKLLCRLPEIQAHTHDSDCYVFPEPEQAGHVHTADCYELRQTDLICTQEAREGHTHTDGCYSEISTLVCVVPEGEGAHYHDDGCYDDEGNLICTLAESDGHQHTQSCYQVTRDLVCELTEEPGHQHTDDCYSWEEVLVCGQEEGEQENEIPAEPELICGKQEILLHTHQPYVSPEDPGCYDADGNLVCGQIQILEHPHTEDCFATVEEPLDTEALTCTLPEEETHTHGPLCYGTWELTCEQQEHTHSDACRSLAADGYFCGITEHTHDESCYSEDGEQICGMEEHTHTLACASDPTADVETAQVWEQSFADVRLTGEWPVDVIVIAESQLGYTESTRNYVVRGDGAVYGYTRYGAWYGSPYDDWCAMFVAFCLHYANVEYTPMEPGCQNWIEALERLDRYRPADGEYVPSSGDLIFFDGSLDGQLDHVGLVADVFPATEEEPARIRTIEGNASDTVQYVTYDQDDPVILGYGQLPEQTFYCGKTGHVHTQDCQDPCQLEEHIHTDSCLLPPEEPKALTYEGPDYTVTVQYGADAELPEGVTLAVSEIPVDSEEYQDYLQQATAAMEAAGKTETVIFARFFDVQFRLDGEKIEPAAAVSVTITYAEPVETTGDVNCQAVHFAEEGTELLDVTTEQQEDGSTSFTHTQEGFSVTGYLVSVAADINSADVGPNSLPVDYYVCIDGEWTCVGSTKTGWYGDYTATGWTDYNRDYITVAQAESILGAYGFTGNETNPARLIAYQQKSIDTLIYSDTNSVDINGQNVIPLSRNGNHPGFNVYYLPKNTAELKSISSPDNLDKAANSFYTVKVYNGIGELLASDLVFTGDNFTYTHSETDAISWLVAYGDGRTDTITGSTITVESITSSVIISPGDGSGVGSHSVTFKVMIDGEWKTVGSLPYYYSGVINSSDRAYITSAMAAQILGQYGYIPTENPNYRFGYSYNDIYTIRYLGDTNYCIDIINGTISNGTYIQLYESNGTEAQIFRIRDPGNGNSFITPVTNSSLHINIPGKNMATNQQLWIHEATDEASQWKVNFESDGTVTFQSAVDIKFYMVLQEGSINNGTEIQISTDAGNGSWKLDQQYRISNNTVSSQNNDGTYNIGLTAESNGDIVCYYMPAETTSEYENASESEINTANSLWSVRVRDDTNTVYSDGELSTMVWYVSPGGEKTVTVKNADGILWSCTGTSNVTATQSGGYTTFTIRNINGPVEVVATKANPSFTVQYYANIPRFATSGDKSLTVIDTSGAVLPTNGGSMATKSLYLEGTGQYTNQNNGDSTQLYRIATTTELIKMYTEKECDYASEPGLAYFNKLKDNEDYVLNEIWVLKEGKDAASTNRSDWDVYSFTESTTFTNEAGQAGENNILINDGGVLRLVYNSSSGTYYNGTTFYDYNISSGQNDDGRWRTGITGINIESNYGTSLEHEQNWRSGANILAFGNANCGTGMSGYLFDGGPLNKWNGTNQHYTGKNTNYGGATFGLAAGLNQDGTIRYNEWIVVPKLFNDGDANGKQTYSGSSLTFDRVGDTYTLSSATLNNSNGQSNTISGLQYFFNPSPTSGTTHTHIFTNNFWPMDPAAGRTDALWGQYDNPGSFQGFVETNDYNWSDLAANFPVSDDGNAHNWFFGMNFAISFNLTADYEGPLEYYFFGDDDLWVFLDGKLVCDIGGVHSSIGEFVNLRDYLPVGSSGQHTLSFFYTERGASGSTCYMSFTLPSVSSATTSQNTGSLKIEKTLEQTGGVDYSGEEYKFMVELLTAENGSALNQTFSYSRSDATYGTIKSGGTVALHQDESITISGIPAGTYYQVTELTTEGYQTTVNGNKGYIVAGNIINGNIQTASFVNKPYHELPSTGGSGTYLYTFSGIAVVAFVLVYIIRKRKGEMFS